MIPEVKQALDRVVDMILFGDINEVPLSILKKRLRDIPESFVTPADPHEAHLVGFEEAQLNIAATVQWMIENDEMMNLP